MLEHSFGRPGEAAIIEKAVKETLYTGTVTKDLNPLNHYSTTEVGDTIASMISNKVVEIV